MMSAINPFIGKSLQQKVNTPVVSTLVDRCTTSKRRRRRSATAVGLSQGSSTLLNINIPPTTLGLFANATPKSENEGIATSEFNLTSPVKVPLVIRVTPSEPSRVNVFIRRDAVPTSTVYDWLLTSWDNNNDNYTLYVAADLTKDVTHIYVGVQSVTGKLMTSLIHYDLFAANCITLDCYRGQHRATYSICRHKSFVQYDEVAQG